MDRPSSAGEYDADYYAHYCAEIPYERVDRWLQFFAGVADRIVADIAPASVMDVGCAMGFLVEALRGRGVEAFGIDLSDHAIAGVHPDIAAFCRVARATDPFDRRYDLVVCVEVIEHLSREEADAAVANICAHTDDVLLSSSPFEFAELTHLNVRPPDHWVGLFARHGFVRDLEFDAGFITPWTMRLRKSTGELATIVRAYEREVWQLSQERQARRDLAIGLRADLSARDAEVIARRAREEALATERDDLAERLQGRTQEVQVLAASLRAWEHRWWELETSMAWAGVRRLQDLRFGACPPGSRREGALVGAYWWYQLGQREGLGGLLRQVRRAMGRRARLAAYDLRRRAPTPGASRLVVPEVVDRPALRAHAARVDVIVCVHDAQDDVRACLESVVRYSGPPAGLILVDDGSAEPTADYLADFARRHGATAIRNEDARGYTRAANQGLARSTADFAVLLNSDTIVTHGWLDRMIACAESDPRIGLVGPLSNTASWQSVPEVFDGDDWADNPLPDGLNVDGMADLVAGASARLYPDMPFLNGFCLLVRRGLIDAIGTFDEVHFGDGYGEENDYALRARKAGWRLALADDTFVFHAQSKSYSHERRLQLYERANAGLTAKHGQPIIDEGTAYLRADRVLEGVRARARVLDERRAIVAEGRARFADRRLLFVLPVMSAGGGANIVIGEARAMRAMGVSVSLFNVDRFRSSFERAYPELDLPVIYGRYDEVPQSLTEHVADFDAVVGTIFASVRALDEVSRAPGGDRLVFGYYVQDFEPYFFEPGSENFHRAWQSYKLMPNLVRFTKTEWNRREIETLIGVDSHVVGPSFDADLFRPRPRPGPELPDRPVRVAAMIRPETPYRNPQLTMTVLADAARRFGSAIDVRLFGCEPDTREFQALPHAFPWRSAGALSPRQVAAFLNEVDVFVDFSSHQAMGLTALEAMACGAAVVVSGRGGAGDFARDQGNCLLVDASSTDACRAALDALIQDADLRTRLQRQAIHDAARYFPERPARNILRALFGTGR